MPFELVEQPPQTAMIKVIGVGGGGGNAVQHMVSKSVEGVDFIAANTDAQALGSLDVPTPLQLGASITRGLGAGTNPEVGEAAALEDRDKIKEALTGADMVFITAGMGGGTGTGAAPVVAEVAKELDALAVAVVTKPFDFENRMSNAERGIDALYQHVDSLIAIPNEKLLTVLGEDATMDEAFGAANDVLLGAVQGIADIIIRPGRINVDFADVRTVMSERGLAIMGTGQVGGEGRARNATQQAIHSPLLDDVDLRGARGVVVNITTAPSLSIREFQAVGDTIREFTSKDTTVVVGTVEDPDLGDEMRVTVVATGLRSSIRPPDLVVDNTRRGPARAGRSEYEELDHPTVMRQRAVAGGEPVPDPDYLDIPSFLRRQND